MQRVFEEWPHWNNSNTVIIDHKIERVGCNRKANAMVTKSFYMVDMEMIEDDSIHLKSLV